MDGLLTSPLSALKIPPQATWKTVRPKSWRASRHGRCLSLSPLTRRTGPLGSPPRPSLRPWRQEKVQVLVFLYLSFSYPESLPCLSPCCVPGPWFLSSQHPPDTRLHDSTHELLSLPRTPDPDLEWNLKVAIVIAALAQRQRRMEILRRWRRRQV